MKQTVEQQEACADDMRTSLRHKELCGESFATNPAAQALQKTNPRLTPHACLKAVGITESFAANPAAQALQKADPRLTPRVCLQEVRRLESFATNPAAQAKQIADNLRTTAMYVAHEETKRLFDNRAKANLLQRAHDVQVDPAIIARWQNGAPGTEEAFLKRALLIAIKRGVKTASKKQKVHG
jgi:hypothetical protein